MAKKKNSKAGEQMDLIDVHPENAKKIIKAAEAYKDAQGRRISALAEEKKYKQKIIDLAEQAELKPLDNGKTKFSVDGAEICITPRDKLVQVKFKKDKEQ